MERNKIITIFIVIIIVVAVFSLVMGIIFRDRIINYYNSFNKQVEMQVTFQIQNFKKTNIGSVVSKTGKEILSPSPLDIGGVNNDQIILLKSKIITETNLQRQENGNLSVLKENEELDEAAAAKANDLFKNQYFEHVSPTGIDPGKLVQSYGYDYITAGENLILGNFSSEKEVVQDWMNSPEHRENILNGRYTEMGAAIIKGTYKGDTVWIGVQEFGLPLSACTQPDSSLKAQIDADNHQLDTWSVQITEQKSQIDATSPNSQAYGEMVDDYNRLVNQYNSLADNTKQLVIKYNNLVNIFNNCVAGK